MVQKGISAPGTRSRAPWPALTQPLAFPSSEPPLPAPELAGSADAARPPLPGNALHTYHCTHTPQTDIQTWEGSTTPAGQ